MQLKNVKLKEIYSIGGPSAIAAITYGTKKIKPVNKIVGPGNSYSCCKRSFWRCRY